MNCTEIHEGFPQKEIRDFLSLAIAKAYQEEFDSKKTSLSHSTYDDTFNWAIDDAKEQIKYLKKYIENIETKKALLMLIERNGWKEHDVSDDVYNNTEYRLHMNFIGTENELEELHHKIYPQDDTRT